MSWEGYFDIVCKQCCLQYLPWSRTLLPLQGWCERGGLATERSWVGGNNFCFSYFHILTSEPFYQKRSLSRIYILNDLWNQSSFTVFNNIAQVRILDTDLAQTEKGVTRAQLRRCRLIFFSFSKRDKTQCQLCKRLAWPFFPLPHFLFSGPSIFRNWKTSLLDKMMCGPCSPLQWAAIKKVSRERSLQPWNDVRSNTTESQYLQLSLMVIIMTSSNCVYGCWCNHGKSFFLFVDSTGSLVAAKLIRPQ